MTSYYRCDGSVSADPSGAVQCSTGWLVVDEPTFTLASQEQVSDLLVAILLLVALWKVFGLLFNLMGVRS